MDELTLFRRRKAAKETEDPFIRLLKDALLRQGDPDLVAAAQKGELFELLIESGQVPPGFVWPNAFIHTPVDEWNALVLQGVVERLRTTAMDPTPHVQATQRSLQDAVEVGYAGLDITELYHDFAVALLTYCYATGHATLVDNREMIDDLAPAGEEPRWEPLGLRATERFAGLIQTGLFRNEGDITFGVSPLMPDYGTWDPLSPSDVLGVLCVHIDASARELLAEWKDNRG